MRVPIEVEVPAVNISITLPANVPLMCGVDDAAKLFGMSRDTLEKLSRIHPDIPVKAVGRSVKYLVPDLYAWFRDYPEKRIPTE